MAECTTLGRPSHELHVRAFLLPSASFSMFPYTAWWQPLQGNFSSALTSLKKQEGNEEVAKSAGTFPIFHLQQTH